MSARYLLSRGQGKNTSPAITPDLEWVRLPGARAYDSKGGVGMKPYGCGNPDWVWLYPDSAGHILMTDEQTAVLPGLAKVSSSSAEQKESVS